MASEQNRKRLAFAMAGVAVAFVTVTLAGAGFAYSAFVFILWSSTCLILLARGHKFTRPSITAVAIAAAVLLAFIYGLAWNRVKIMNRSGRTIEFISLSLDLDSSNSLELAGANILTDYGLSYSFFDLFNDGRVHVQGVIRGGTDILGGGVRTRVPGMFGGLTTIVIESDGTVRIHGK